MDSKASQLSKLIKEISVYEQNVNIDREDLPQGVKANWLSMKLSAQSQLSAAINSYYDILRGNVELILLSGEGEEGAIANFDKIGAVTVDAQGFYRDVVARSAINGDLKTINVDSFIILNQALKSLAYVSKVALPRTLELQHGDESLDFEENIRNTVRSQFGGAGCEPAFVLHESMVKAVKARSSEVPLLAVAYNLKGATEREYNGVFNSIHTFEAKTGDEDEIKSFISNVREKLISQGKIENKKPKTTGTKNKKEAKEQ